MRVAPRREPDLLDECFIEPPGRSPGGAPRGCHPRSADYSLLQLDFGRRGEGRGARSSKKWCHPDIAGEAGLEVCIILNEAYDTLMDEKERGCTIDVTFASCRSFANLLRRRRFRLQASRAAAASKFAPPRPRGGPPLCSSTASDADSVTTRSESFIAATWARARSRFSSGGYRGGHRHSHGDAVDCIYWVKQRNLPILEYAMQRCERATVGVMNGSNVRVGDPFDVANSMIRKGEEARARMGMDPSGAMERRG